MYGESPHGRQPPEMAQIFTECGFDAVTIANNHMYDFGPEPLLDTRALLLEQGIQVTGAGKNLEEARSRPSLSAKGSSSAFSVIPRFSRGRRGGRDKVGVAPLRVKTSYEPSGPHAPARVRTKPDERDLK